MKPQYTVPQPGLLTPDRPYYWHVRAKNAQGVWGPWSQTWIKKPPKKAKYAPTRSIARTTRFCLGRSAQTDPLSSPHRTTGYECFARCVNNASSYVEIVRWDGGLGKFTYLARQHGTNYGLNQGDILKASIGGKVVTVFVNGVEKARATDDTFKTGNPGIGEFLRCDRGRGLGSNPDFGFARFTARGLGGK